MAVLAESPRTRMRVSRRSLPPRNEVLASAEASSMSTCMFGA
jgi:hypothetical protein